MKKLLALSLLAVTVLSGCAVYPSGYVETSGYTYSQPSGVVYVDETYINRFPDTYIWVNREPRWNDYRNQHRYYNKPYHNRPGINRPDGNHHNGDKNHHRGERPLGDNKPHNVHGRDRTNNGDRPRSNMGQAVRQSENK